VVENHLPSDSYPQLAGATKAALGLHPAVSFQQSDQWYQYKIFTCLLVHMFGTLDRYVSNILGRSLHTHSPKLYCLFRRSRIARCRRLRNVNRGFKHPSLFLHYARFQYKTSH